ncbi:hypothetical protein [Frankia sp. Cas4]|uniref:hypothetical protein n=1 Tax=Frankia sp. Cas4 TaxID=3073927 RepID=UPI002AD49026|nr:hypothetical protein [Frankia sp. Cas4]
MTRQTSAPAAPIVADYFPPELRQLCRTAVRVLHEHIEVGGLCVVCGVSWPCESTRLADHNLTLL